MTDDKSPPSDSGSNDVGHLVPETQIEVDNLISVFGASIFVCSFSLSSLIRCNIFIPSIFPIFFKAGTVLGGIGGWRHGKRYAHSVIEEQRFLQELDTPQRQRMFIGKTSLIHATKYAVVGSAFFSLFGCTFEGSRILIRELAAAAPAVEQQEREGGLPASTRARQVLRNHADGVASMIAAQITSLLFGFSFFRSAGMPLIARVSGACALGSFVLVSGHQYLQGLLPALEERARHYEKERENNNRSC